jgi:hypothetical protein
VRERLFSLQAAYTCRGGGKGFPVLAQHETKLKRLRG